MDEAARARYADLVLRPACALVVIALSLGCSGAPAPEPVSPRADDEHQGEPPRESEDLRALGRDATFATLLEAARTLDQRRDQESSAGCLVRRPGPEWRLEADLAVAVRPLPPSRADLDGALEADAGPVNVLSRWGAYGSGEPQRPSLVAVTTTLPPLREPAIVWAITGRGVYVRSSAGPASPAEPRQDRELAAALPSSIGALFVTAESTTPLERLAEVLALVPPELAGRVALAVVLEPGTRLPQPSAPAPSASASEGLCPDGLPPLSADAPAGELRPERIVQSLGPLRQGGEICASASQGPGAAGGRVALALRIGADGTVTDACAVRDDTGDPELRACLLRAARAVSFPAPDPPGTIDVELPLVLAPLASQRQAPLCP